MLSVVKCTLLAVTFSLGSFSALASRAGWSHHHRNSHSHHPPNHDKIIRPFQLAFVPLQIADNSVRGRPRRHSATAREGGHPHQHQSRPTHVFTKPAKNDVNSRLPLFSSSSDTIIDKPNDNSSALEKAQQLREKARDLRREATTAEQNLRNTKQEKKDVENKEADELVDLLLGTIASISSEIAGKATGENGNDGVETTKVTTPSDNNIPSAQTLALRIKENSIGIIKLKKVIERLHDRETAMMMGPEGYLSKQESSISGGGGGFVLGDYENNSLESKEEETGRITGLLDRILDAVQLLDDEGLSTDQPDNGKSIKLASKLRVRVTDLRQNRNALLKNRVDILKNRVDSLANSSDGSIDGYVRSSIDGDDGNESGDKKRSKEKRMLEILSESPAWLPLQIAPFAATSPVEVSVSHWKMIKTDLLSADSGFVCTSWDCTQVAGVFRGRMARTSRNDRSSPEIDDGKEKGDNSITAIFEELQARLENHAELKDRIRLFLVDDNEWRPDNGSRQNDNEENGPPPVIIALAKEVSPEQESERVLSTKALAAFSALATVLTTLAYAIGCFALNPTFFNAVVKENDITAVPLALPIFFGVLAVSALHEAGHIVAAKKHGVKLGFPVPLPSLHVGSFGSITPLRSFPPTRGALFDVAIGGPGVSILVSMILLVVGLSLTISSQSLATFPVVPAAMMKSSFLVGSIVSVVAPKMMMVPLSQPIPIHPCFLVGLAGLVMSAVNLLPIGRLDGGRACMATRGRRVGGSVSLLSLVILLVYSFTNTSGIFWSWGAIVVLTQQRFSDIPCIDEVTGVGDLRNYSYIALLTLALLALAPFPGGVGPI